MAEPDRKTLLQIFEITSTISTSDKKFQSLIMSGTAALMYYPPRGQEVIAAAAGVNLRPDDYVVTSYRGIHDQIAKGVPLRQLFAECLGRFTGTCKGKGGAMHITHPLTGLMVTTGIVGGGLPIANGLALASALRGSDRVTVCNFGDGASNIGAFHEALNLASLWRLPVVFLCQNNGYAEHTTYANGTTIERISDRASAYSMPGVTVDGRDALAMYDATAEAIARARSGEGPTLLEATTYRIMGHFFGDSAKYMPADEVAAARAADPVPGYRTWLLTNEHTSESELAAIEQRVSANVDDAAEFALASAYPEADEIHLDVYSETR